MQTRSYKLFSLSFTFSENKSFKVLVCVRVLQHFKSYVCITETEFSLPCSFLEGSYKQAPGCDGSK